MVRHTIGKGRSSVGPGDGCLTISSSFSTPTVFSVSCPIRSPQPLDKVKMPIYCECPAPRQQATAIFIDVSGLHAASVLRSGYRLMLVDCWMMYDGNWIPP